MVVTLVGEVTTIPAASIFSAVELLQEVVQEVEQDIQELLPPQQSLPLPWTVCILLFPSLKDHRLLSLLQQPLTLALITIVTRVSPRSLSSSTRLSSLPRSITTSFSSSGWCRDLEACLGVWSSRKNPASSSWTSLKVI